MQGKTANVKHLETKVKRISKESGRNLAAHWVGPFEPFETTNASRALTEEVLLVLLLPGHWRMARCLSLTVFDSS